MNFKELMDRYKRGEASQEEIELVEQELEKYEVIEEYYADIVDMDFASSWEGEEGKKESLNIKKSVNRKFKKIILSSVGAMIALLLIVFFLISPLIDSFFYIPSKSSISKTEMDIYFDLKVITELNMPKYDLSSLIDVDRKGFGEYDIGFHRLNHFTKESSYVISKIKRNEVYNTSTSLLEVEYGAFRSVNSPDFYDSQIVQEENQRAMDHIRQLSPVSYVSSWLTFEEDLTMDELYELEQAYPDMDFAWVAIRTPDSQVVYNMLGFRPDYSIRIDIEDGPDTEKYPALDIYNFLINPGMAAAGRPYLEAVAYEEHYKDLLRYTLDRKEAIEALEYNPNKYEFYEEALAYAESNGVKSYGILAYGNASDLIDFVEEGPIYHIQLDDIMVSRKNF